MKFHVDRAMSHRIMGWAFFSKHDGPIGIEAWQNRTLLGKTIANRSRPDVGRAFPGIKAAANSGFILPIDLPSGLHVVEIVAVTPSGKQRLTKAEIRRFTEAELCAAAAPPMSPSYSPFPSAVVEAVRVLTSEASFDWATDSGQNTFVDAFLSVASNNDIARVDPVIQYIRFLRAVWKHCEFVDRYFPGRNLGRSVGAKDYNSPQTSSLEIMSIVNHLYVLKSAGIHGAFAEFGCFKGFGSVKLSYACNLLGIPMLIFDSFEGLPPSDSKYYKTGDFAGDFEEVFRNIKTFGAIEGTTLHKGFFAESIKNFFVPPLISIFMDVDLRSSAVDVMQVANKIDPRGALFSHECGIQHFAPDGTIIPGTVSSQSVVPPIVDAFSEMGVALSGRYLYGSTGSFWRGMTGIPVASNASIARLAKAL